MYDPSKCKNNNSCWAEELSATLKPCKFCGCTKAVIGKSAFSDMPIITCENCLCSISLGYDVYELVHIWNS